MFELAGTLISISSAILSAQRNRDEVFEGVFESVQDSYNKHFGPSVRESDHHSARDTTSCISHSVSTVGLAGDQAFHSIAN